MNNSKKPYTSSGVTILQDAVAVGGKDLEGGKSQVPKGIKRDN